MSQKDDEKDLANAQAEWAGAANRRLKAMKEGGVMNSVNPMPWLNETMSDFNLRAQEGKASEGTAGANLNPMSPIPQTKARLLDWEQAAKQAQDPNAPLPSFDPNAKPSK